MGPAFWSLLYSHFYATKSYQSIKAQLDIFPSRKNPMVSVALGEFSFAISLISLILSLCLLPNYFVSQSNLPKYVASSLETLP